MDFAPQNAFEQTDDYKDYMKDPEWEASDERTVGHRSGKGREHLSRVKNVGTIFLNECRKHKVQVSVYLRDGTELRGVIDAFDQNGIILSSTGSQNLIFFRHMLHIMALGDEPPYKTG